VGTTRLAGSRASHPGNQPPDGKTQLPTKSHARNRRQGIRCRFITRRAPASSLSTRPRGNGAEPTSQVQSPKAAAAGQAPVLQLARQLFGESLQHTGVDCVSEAPRCPPERERTWPYWGDQGLVEAELLAAEASTGKAFRCQKIREKIGSVTGASRATGTPRVAISQSIRRQQHPAGR